MLKGFKDIDRMICDEKIISMQLQQRQIRRLVAKNFHKSRYESLCVYCEITS